MKLIHILTLSIAFSFILPPSVFANPVPKKTYQIREIDRRPQWMKDQDKANNPDEEEEKKYEPIPNVHPKLPNVHPNRADQAIVRPPTGIRPDGKETQPNRSQTDTKSNPRRIPGVTAPGTGDNPGDFAPESETKNRRAHAITPNYNVQPESFVYPNAFDEMLREISSKSFGSDQVAVVRAHRNEHFSSDQVYKIMKALKYDTDRVDVGMMLYPKVRDPQNWSVVYGAITFSSNRAALERQTSK